MRSPRFRPSPLSSTSLKPLPERGFERHLQFLENVKSYAQQYRIFIADTDQADPESLHIFGIREGMSQKPVPLEAIPKFEDTLSFSKDFNTAAVRSFVAILVRHSPTIWSVSRLCPC